jgi:hypothetical protein
VAGQPGRLRGVGLSWDRPWSGPAGRGWSAECLRLRGRFGFQNRELLSDGRKAQRRVGRDVIVARLDRAPAGIGGAVEVSALGEEQAEGERTPRSNLTATGCDCPFISADGGIRVPELRKHVSEVEGGLRADLVMTWGSGKFIGVDCSGVIAVECQRVGGSLRLRGPRRRGTRRSRLSPAP